MDAQQQNIGPAALPLPAAAAHKRHGYGPHIHWRRRQRTAFERLKHWRPFTGVSKDYFKTDFENDLAAALSEFLGTITFLIIGLGGIQSAAASVNAAAAVDANGSGAASVNAVATIDQLMFISASMGLALLGSAWIFFRVTGSAFNPNISLALWLCNVISFPRFVLYCLSQIIGAIVASAILSGILPGTLSVTPTLGAGTTAAQGVWIEAFITAALCLSVLMLAVEKHRATAWAPIGIALTLFACHLFAVVYTGAAMNVARAFGPAVLTGFDTNHWVYWVGDGIGSILAVIIYIVLKAGRYWKLNPDADTHDVYKSPELFNPVQEEPATIDNVLAADGLQTPGVEAHQHELSRTDSRTMSGVGSSNGKSELMGNGVYNEKVGLGVDHKEVV